MKFVFTLLLYAGAWDRATDNWNKLIKVVAFSLLLALIYKLWTLWKKYRKQ